MKQLIVNADDFGLTSGVTRGILDAHRHGIVTSTTLMANGAAFDMAVTASRQAPALGIGIHLNLSEGSPVSSLSEILSLVTDQGRLHLTPGRLLRGILTRRINPAEVETELRAQISKVVHSGISPTHVDGHKHVHVLPGVSEVVIRLAREFAIPSIRCPMEESLGFVDTLEAARSGRASILKQHLVARGVSFFARQLRKRLAEAGLRCPSSFHGLTYTGFLNSLRIREVLGRMQDGTSELMCHPGYPDAELAKTGTRLLIEREIEVFALCSPAIKKSLVLSGIELVNYHALAGLSQYEAAAA